MFDSEEVHELRTLNNFANQEYENHQIARSPLLHLDIDCIKQFSLDYMHLVCLGVVKRILSFLTGGPLESRLSARQKGDISAKLLEFNGLMPSEFARQPRSLSELDRWKATEFRQFLLYTGPIVLRGVVSSDIYSHFMVLSIAISIMLDANSEKREAHIDYAQNLLAYFVSKSKDIYGDTFTVYNVHNILHLHEDVRYFKCSLNEISAFPFENHLQKIKKLVKNAKNPIAQVTKRLDGIARTQPRHANQKHSVSHISTRKKDRCFMLENGKISFLQEKRPNGELVFGVIGQQHLSNFYTSPCESKLLHVFFVRDTVVDTRSRMKVLRTVDISRKVVCLPYKDGIVISPLLHGVEHH